MESQENLIENLFEAALPLSQEDRRLLLDRECRSADDVRHAVEVLLTANDQAGSFLDAPLLAPAFHDEFAAERQVSPTYQQSRDHEGAFQIGAVIGERFTIHRFLARGGMGEVYEAWDSQVQERVAIKTVRPDLSRHLEVVERFRREVKQARAICHPNVCRVHELFTEELVLGEKIFFLSMEFLDGPTLSDYIRHHGPIHPERATHLVRQIVQGLVRAHSLGIVHRDLKTKNILLVADGEGGLRPVITDFGLALNVYEADGILQEPGRQGTPAFMAPEQIVTGKVSFLADQYALGMVICEMLTGTVAEQSDSHFMGVQSRVSVPDKDLPAPWRRIVHRCLEIEPQSRYPKLENLLAELKAEKRRWQIWPAYAIAACVLLGVAGWLGIGGRSQQSSLAVLPLQNKSSDSNLDYIGAGMSEALTNDLAEIPGLHITAQGISSRSRGNGADLISIGRTLNVRNLVNGSFTSAGGMLHVPIELVDVKTGTQIWGKTYDVGLSDLPDLQQEIATDIAYQLKIRLDPDAKARLKRQYATDATTYNAYLMGRFSLAQRSPDALRAAIGEFQNALTSDQRYAPAYAGLADCYSLLAYYGSERPIPLLTSALNASETALRMDSTLGEAYASRAFARTFLRYEWKEAEDDYKRAIELNPNHVVAHTWYALALLTPLGRESEAAGQLSYAQAADPNTRVTDLSIAISDGFSGHVDHAIRRLETILHTSPNFEPAVQALAFDYLVVRRPQDAIQLLLASPPDADAVKERNLILAIAYASAGDKIKASSQLQLVQSDGRDKYSFPYETAIYYTVANDPGRALEMLEIAYNRRSTDMVFLNVDPFFTPLRSEPRFRKLLAEMNLDEPR